MLAVPSGLRAQGEDLAVLRQRAERGDTAAQNTLGNQLTQAQQFREANSWFERAASRGFAPAQFNLGLAHELGRGYPADARAAFRHYLLAAEQGFAPAQFNVGNMYASGRGVAEDQFEAVVWFRQAADKGLPEAQYNLGLAYESGRGIRSDEQQAARWYALAAGQGYARAQYNLGLLHEDGRGVARDEAASARYYRLAAEQGYAPAQNNLGLMYSAGRGGLPADPATGYAWLVLAVEGGASPQGRDFVARNLTPEMQAQVGELIAALRAKLQRAADPAAPTTVATPAEPPSAPVSDRHLREELDRAVAANSRLAEVNQRLTVEKAEIERWAATMERSLNERNAATQPQAANTAELDDLRRQLDAASASTARLERELSAARDRLAAADGAGNARDLQDEIVRLRRLAGEASSLRAINDRLENELQRNRSGGISTTEAEALRNQLTEARTAEKSARDSAEASAAALAAARTETADAAGKLATLQTELAAARAATGSTEQLQQRIDSLSADNAALNDALRKAEEPLLAARRDIDDLRARLAVAESDRDSMRDDALKLRDQLQAARREQSAGSALQEELQQARTRLAALQGTIDERNGAIAALHDQIRVLREAVGTRDDRLAALTANVQQLQGQDNQIASARDEIADLHAKSAAADQQYRSLRDEFLATRNENDRLSALVRDREAELGSLRGQLTDAHAAAGGASADLGRRLAEAQSSLQAGQQRLDQLQAELSRSEEKARQSSVALATAREEAAGARTEIDSLRRQLSAAQTRPVADPAEQNQLRQALAAATQQLEARDRRTADLESQLDEARTIRARSPDEETRVQALRTELAQAQNATDALQKQVAELTAANARLEQDYDNARRSTDAALAAQAQAVSSDRSDAYQVEIRTLSGRIRQLESSLEEDRIAAAREITTLAEQLQKARETGRALGDANRALLAARGADDRPDRAELDHAQGRVRDLTASVAELQRQNAQLTGANTRLEEEKSRLARELTDAESAEGSHNTAVSELTTANDRLERDNTALRTQLTSLTARVDELQRAGASSAQRLAEENQTLQQRVASLDTQLQAAQREAAQLASAQADATATRDRELQTGRTELAALRTRVKELEQVSDSQGTSVAELTGLNGKLETERDELRRQLDAARGENARLAQVRDAADQQRAAAEQSASQNVDALTAQLAVVRRDLDALRLTNQRLTDANAALERERQNAVAQLRQENSALASRLTQAQSTLDQIASAARLGTPAAGIAAGAAQTSSGSSAAPVTAAAEPRFHIVADGDSLSRLSLRYYGTPNRWQEIFNANRDVLQGANSLRVGQRLRIP